MPTILPVTDIVTIGDISTYLSANYTSKKSLFGGSVIKPQPPQQIAYITDALRWGIEGGAETSENNRGMANYLYWLCGYFQLQAQYIMNGPGGGSVVPTPSGGGQPNDIDFIVSASSIIPTDGTSLLLDGTNGNPDLRGYDIDLFRGSQVQYTTPQQGGAAYYRWNNVTGLLNLLPVPGGEALLDEPIRISPKTGGGGTLTPTQSFPIVITSADFESDGVTYLNSTIASVAGNSVYLLANNTPNPILFAPTDFIYVAGGIEIILAGFDANTFNYTIAINQIN